MLVLNIDNPEIERIFVENFNSNKEKFFEFIKNSYKNGAYLADKKRFEKTYKELKTGNCKLYTQEEAEVEIDRFLENLWKL